jgi:hypothetical protein
LHGEYVPLLDAGMIVFEKKRFSTFFRAGTNMSDLFSNIYGASLTFRRNMHFIILTVLTLILSGGMGIWLYTVFQKQSGGLLAAVAVPAVLAPVFLVHLGLSLVQQSQLTFHQFYDGVELSVQKIPIQCERDGFCIHTYTQEVTTQSYSHGTPTTSTTSYGCPYATEEDRWIIHTTVGSFVVGQTFPVHYHVYEDSICDAFTIPQEVVDQAGTGEPRQATLAQEALTRGDPRPATFVTTYQDPIKDYLDNSADPSLEQVTSGDVNTYLKRGVLPQITGDTYDGDQANRVHLVKLPTINTVPWNTAISHLTMETGTLPVLTTRFDIQFVAVNSALVPATEAEGYTLALQAYWEGKQFGQAALPKNMCVILVGTNGQTVQWANGFTLINDGENNELWTALQLDMPGVAFDANTLVGYPKAIVKNGVLVRVVHANSLLERLVITGEFHFQRPHETTNHGGAGFDWLLDDVGPTMGQDLLILLVCTLMTCLLEAVFYGITYKVAVATPSRRNRSC